MGQLPQHNLHGGVDREGGVIWWSRTSPYGRAAAQVRPGQTLRIEFRNTAPVPTASVSRCMGWNIGWVAECGGFYKGTNWGLAMLAPCARAATTKGATGLLGAAGPHNVNPKGITVQAMVLEPK